MTEPPTYSRGKCTYGATSECDCAQPRSLTTKLPDWFDVSAEASEGAPLNPLERFILDHEPAGEHDIKWRDQLVAVIDWVKQQ